MNELVTRFTALPNLHPALVHFPIALWPTAVLFDLATWWWKAQGQNWFGRTAAALYGLGALGAGLAYWAGRGAADSLPTLAVETQLHLNQHADSALYALWSMGVVAAVRIGVEWWDQNGSLRIPRLVVTLAAVACLPILFRTADLGGGLVYQHGVAVAQVEDREDLDRAAPGFRPADDDPIPAMDRPLMAPGGGLEWIPEAADGDALGSILTPAPGSDLSSVSWVEPRGGEEGLGLAVDGDALLVLPGAFGDVQVEMKATLDEYEGEIGLAHHVQSAEQAGIFTLAVPANEFVLASLTAGEVHELDRQGRQLAPPTIQMTVSAIGRHLRGLLGDETVVHGHRPAPPEGACGLLLRGKGTIRVLSMKVTPAGG